MNPDDKVYLVVLLRSGRAFPIPCTAKYANGMMQCWWRNREIARGALNEMPIDATAETMAATLVGAQHWMKTATYASNLEYADRSGSYCRGCFAWEEVVAMYISQPQAPEGEEWKYGGGQ